MTPDATDKRHTLPVSVTSSIVSSLPVVSSAESPRT